MTQFYRFWLILLAIKAALAVWLPFSSDEAYYWVWSHYPQLSYFDHPPFVAWLFWLGQWVDAAGQAVRLPAVLLGHTTLLIWNRLLEPHLDERARCWWLGFVALSPFMGVGSLVVTPDLPLVFFWSLAMVTLQYALQSHRAKAYFALGAVLGLGFCAKYHMVLFVPVAWVWLLVSGRWRDIAWKYLPLTVLAGLLFCAPVWYWNMTNEWVSFRFQLDHGLKKATWKPQWPLQYIAGQLALIFPIVLVLALRRREPRSLRWLHAFAWLPVIFFLYTSFRARVEANWPIIAYPAIFTLAFLNDPGHRWIRVTMGIWAAALLIVISHLWSPWFPIDARKLKTNEMTKYDALVQPSSELTPFFAGSYQMASTLSYRTGRMISKLRGLNRRDFYDFQPMSMPTSEVFYVAVEDGHPLPEWVAQSGASVREAQVVSEQLRILEVRQRARDSHH